MTVTAIHTGATQGPPTEPLPIVKQLQWSNPRPFDNNCLFVDHRANIRAAVNVDRTGAHEYLSVRIDLPDGTHFLLALTRSAQLALIDEMQNADTRRDTYVPRAGA